MNLLVGFNIEAVRPPYRNGEEAKSYLALTDAPDGHFEVNYDRLINPSWSPMSLNPFQESARAAESSSQQGFELEIGA